MLFVNLIAGFAATAGAILVPSVSPGAFSVGLSVKTLTDERRWDPYAPKESPEKRRVLVSAFTPTSFRNESCPNGELDVPYMPPETTRIFELQTNAMGLPDGIFDDLRMRLCRIPDQGIKNGKVGEQRARFPVILFSPGRGVSRLMYSAMARTLASHGYVVLTVDHPYDATIIEFPDGTSVPGVAGVANQTVLEKSTQVRQQDISFIIDMLKDDSAAKEIVGFTRVDRIFIFGHSIGGATTASSLLADDRIRGGINFDGDMLGPVVTSGVDKPLFLIGQPRSHEQGPSWNQTWENLRGPGMMMQIAGTTHQSFLDVPLLVTLRDITEGSEPRIDAALGTIDGRRMAAVVMELVVAVLEFVFDGTEERLCQLSVKNKDHHPCFAKSEFYRMQQEVGAGHSTVGEHHVWELLEGCPKDLFQERFIHDHALDLFIVTDQEYHTICIMKLFASSYTLALSLALVSASPLQDYGDGHQMMKRADGITEYAQVSLLDLPCETELEPGKLDIAWIELIGSNTILRVNVTSGQKKRFKLNNPVGLPSGMEFLPDGYLWLSEIAGNSMVRLDPKDGSMTEYPFPWANIAAVDDLPAGIRVTIDVSGNRDRGAWFTAAGLNAIGRIDIDTFEFDLYKLPNPASLPLII
ncbi:hypothetical protein F66182_10405 [Fusarium sp. NRRL 66182]|nr:hypothetical protein F66182_10405 [Fusarium sp. NRRL 66182]